MDSHDMGPGLAPTARPWVYPVKHQQFHWTKTLDGVPLYCDGKRQSTYLLWANNVGAKQKQEHYKPQKWSNILLYHIIWLIAASLPTIALILPSSSTCWIKTIIIPKQNCSRFLKTPKPEQNNTSGIFPKALSTSPIQTLLLRGHMISQRMISPVSVNPTSFVRISSLWLVGIGTTHNITWNY